MRSRNKLSRRQFLELSTVTATMALLAACTPQAAQPTAKPAEAQETGPTGAPAEAKFEGKVQMWVQFYTPTESMEWSEDNPLPHNMAQVLADEYMQAHPGVSIEIINKPAQTDDHEWIVTGQAGGTIPHVCWTHSFWVNGEIDKNWWVPLDPFLAEPNPYCESGQPGSARWLDEFFEVPTENKRSPDGKLYVLPLDLVTTFFFFNKNLFEQYGVEAPKTYGQFLSAMETIKSQGAIPFGTLNWYQFQIGGMIYAKKAKEINPSGGAISLETAACAIKNGKYRGTDAEYKEWLTLVKKIVPYLAPDWAAAGTDFNQKFLNQEIAILEDGSWRFGSLRANSLLKFEWSTFYAPTVTVEDSAFSTGEAANPIGGATAAQWAISTRAEKENILPTVVDILRFYSAPKNAGRMISEVNSFLPNIKGVEVSQDLKDALNAVSGGQGEAAMLTYPDKFDTETQQKMEPLWNNFKLDQISLEEAQQQIDDLMSAYADGAIEKNNWSCG